MGVIFFIAVWVGCGFLCEYLGRLKGRKGCFLDGLLLGIIGVIIVLCIKDKSDELNSNNGVNKYEDLAKLQKLKEEGIITEIEFELEKQKLLR